MTELPDPFGKQITIPAQTFGALITALSATIAEIDRFQGRLTTQEFLDRVESWVENPSKNLPALLLDEERLLREYLVMLRAGVILFQQNT